MTLMEFRRYRKKSDQEFGIHFDQYVVDKKLGSAVKNAFRYVD